MNIPNCGEKCPLDQFKAIYKDIIPNDLDSECAEPEEKKLEQEKKLAVRSIKYSSIVRALAVSIE